MYESHQALFFIFEKNLVFLAVWHCLVIFIYQAQKSQPLGILDAIARHFIACEWAALAVHRSTSWSPWVGGKINWGFQLRMVADLYRKKDGEGFVNPGKEELHHTRGSHILLWVLIYFSSCVFLLNIVVARGSMVWCTVRDSFGGAAACFVLAISCPLEDDTEAGLIWFRSCARIFHHLIWQQSLQCVETGS